MQDIERIENLGDIAALANCARATVSKAKNHRESVQMDHYLKFSEITGIELETWIRGDRRILKRELRKFFKKEKYKTAAN